MRQSEDMQSEIEKHYDVVVVGAGPAGMSAAVILSQYGLNVAVFDEQATPGGQIYRYVQSADGLLASVVSKDRLTRASVMHGSELVDRFYACDACYFPQSFVWNLESLSCIAVRRDNRVYQTSARYIVLATGAQERPVSFKGWELPGVMGVGAAQIMLKSTGALPQSPPVLFGSGPLLYLYAVQLKVSGLLPEAILDTSTSRDLYQSLRYLPAALRARQYLVDGVHLLRELRSMDVPHYRNVSLLKAFGSSGVERVEFTVGGRSKSIETDLLLSHHGVIPELQLLRAAGVKCYWSDSGQCWHPSIDEWGASNVAGVYVCGDGAGIGGAYSAEYRAELASVDILFRAGVLISSDRDRLASRARDKSNRVDAIRPFLESRYKVSDSLLRASGDTIVCRCESVTADQITNAVEQGCRGPNQVKSFTRCGMGACQGRMCGPTIEAIVADQTGSSRAAVGFLRSRPPLRPITLGELASLDQC